MWLKLCISVMLMVLSIHVIRADRIHRLESQMILLKSYVFTRLDTLEDKFRALNANVSYTESTDETSGDFKRQKEEMNHDIQDFRTTLAMHMKSFETHEEELFMMKNDVKHTIENASATVNDLVSTVNGHVMESRENVSDALEHLQHVADESERKMRSEMQTDFENISANIMNEMYTQLNGTNQETLNTLQTQLIAAMTQATGGIEHIGRTNWLKELNITLPETTAKAESDLKKHGATDWLKDFSLSITLPESVEDIAKFNYYFMKAHPHIDWHNDLNVTLPESADDIARFNYFFMKGHPPIDLGQTNVSVNEEIKSRRNEIEKTVGNLLDRVNHLEGTVDVMGSTIKHDIIDIIGNIHSSWGNWSAWSNCSQTCDTGTKSRKRTCHAPPPLANNTCNGNYTETEICVNAPCENAPGAAPRNVKARPHSPHTILIDWEEPEIPNGIIQGYRVFYITNPDLPIVLWHNQEVTWDSKMATITGLEPDATYYICVLAYSSMGQGPLSIPQQVMTTQGDPLLPRNLQAKAISPNEIEIMWSEPEDVDKIISYKLYYNNSDKRQIGSHTIYPPATKYKLSELTPDTVYNIQMAARSVKGEGKRTIIVQEITLELIPNEPEQVFVHEINSSAIYVNWRPPIVKDRNGIIRGYHVYYNVIDDNGAPMRGQQQLVDTADGNKNGMIITGLRPGTRYQVSVAAYTRKNDGVRSRPKVVRTKGAVPSEPRFLVAELYHQSPLIVLVSWHKPDKSNGVIKAYKLYWGLKNEKLTQVVLKSDQQAFFIHHIEPGRTSEFRLSAKNDNDYGGHAVVELVTPDRG